MEARKLRFYYIISRTMLQNGISYIRKIYEDYPLYRSDAFRRRSFPPEIMNAFIGRLEEKPAGILKTYIAGVSFEGRPIRLVKTGTGSIKVLLWSQMHGDEPTATMAICDILNYLQNTGKESMTVKILSGLTLYFLPMLNPDGAVRFRRRNAQAIDINRDALAVQTPEAKILRSLQEKLKPDFGFNLHDQELSTVEATGEITAIGLLAPSVNMEKSENSTVLRAKQIADVFAASVNEFVPGKVAKYDDTFEPRAFGDNMQKGGTSTILVESGHMPGDPLKDIIRRLNFTGILTTLASIATGDYAGRELSNYNSLPLNSKRAYDLIIRNVRIDHGGGTFTDADLGISYQVDTHSEMPPKLVDLGDLHPFTALNEIGGRGLKIPSSSLIPGEPFNWQDFFPGLSHPPAED